MDRIVVTFAVVQWIFFLVTQFIFFGYNMYGVIESGSKIFGFSFLVIFILLLYYFRNQRLISNDRKSFGGEKFVDFVNYVRPVRYNKGITYNNLLKKNVKSIYKFFSLRKTA